MADYSRYKTETLKKCVTRLLRTITGQPRALAETAGIFSKARRRKGWRGLRNVMRPFLRSWENGRQPKERKVVQNERPNAYQGVCR